MKKFIDTEFGALSALWALSTVVAVTTTVLSAGIILLLR